MAKNPEERSNQSEISGTDSSENDRIEEETEGEGQLSQRAAIGTAWTLLGFGGGQVLRLISNLVLTRLLFAEAFGMMALTMAFLIGISLFSDVGIGPAIIQDRRGSKQSFLDTAWTIQVIRGFGLAVVTLLLAHPFSNLYGEEDLAYMLCVAGLAPLFQGFNSTKLFTLNRKLVMKRLIVLELVSQLVSLAITITWAFLHRSVWALIGGHVISCFVRMLLSHFILPGVINRFYWNREYAVRLFRFGRWIFMSTTISFFSNYSDRLIFGKLIPLTLLGVYNIGLHLAHIPSLILVRLSNRIVFPVYSEIENAGGDVAEVFARVRWPLLLLGGWMISGLIAGGPTVIELFYDDRYLDAGWIVSVLSIGSWFHIMSSTYDSALLSKGNSNWMAFNNFAKFIGMVILVPLGFIYADFFGAVLAYSLSEIACYVAACWTSRKVGIVSFIPDLVPTLVVAGASILGSLCVLILQSEHVVVRSLVVFVAVTVVWTPFGYRFYTRYKTERLNHHQFTT